MELSAFDLRIQDHVIDLLVIYRYPNTSVVSFCNDLADILGNNILTLKGHCILTGDFNICIDDTSDNNTRTLNDMLDSLGMINHITFPTHKQGHTPDLFIEEGNSPLIMKVTRGHLMSDHHFIHAHLNICKNKPEVNEVTFRKYKRINMTTFKEELQRTLQVKHTTHDLTSLVNRYNSDLRKILDKHAPEKKRLVKITHKQPWFTDKIRREIILRRVKEWKWLQDQSYYSFMAFYHQRRYVANTIQQAKREYYSMKLEENRNNVKAVFTIANNLLFRNEPLPLPPTNNKQKLANEFNEFFRTKIQKIMDDLQPAEEHDTEPHYIETDYITNHRFNEFKTMDENTILKLIKESKTKSCKLDPAPATLLKQYTEILVPSIQSIINASLSQGSFTYSLKTAMLRPLLKKPNLEPVFKNYHPVSNLGYLSKIVEKVVCTQITSFAAQTKNTEDLQSAYREDHSTETALLKVKTDLLKALDNQEISCLILLDLSAAFDTVSHKLLLNRLKYRFGF